MVSLRLTDARRWSIGITLPHNRAMGIWNLPAALLLGGPARTVLDIVQDGISIQDKGHNIIAANQALANVLDIPVDEIVGRKCCEVYYCREEACAHCPLIEAQRTSNIIVKQGKIHEVQAYPLIDNEANVKAVLGYVRDVTRQNEIQPQINQAEESAEVRRLISIMSHEVRNPLSIIQMSIGYLSDHLGTSAPKVNKHLQIIREETGRANRIIQDVVAYTKPVPPHYERIRVGTQVRLALMKASVELNGKKIGVVKNLDKNSLEVQVDKDHLQQVLQNLIRNACQAMPAGGCLTVSTSASGGTGQPKFAEIRISDTGDGIAEEKIKEIFEPFFTTKRDGMGLGLYISRSLVERYHGEMVVQSCKGKGTTFVVRFPCGA